MRPFLAVLALLAAPLHGAEPPRRALGIADLYRANVIEAQALSPDGRWAVVAVKRYELERGKSRSELHRVALDGSEVRQLTFGEHHDGSPVFSADGANLFFVSDRGGEEDQLFVMAIDGGEPRQLTKFALGVGDPVASPDGRHLAVTSKVYPECGADDACNRKTFETWRDGPLTAHVADSLLYRHWTSWADGRFPHVLLVDAQSGAVVRDLTPWPRESPTFSAAGTGGYTFSPDGKELCFVSNPDADAATSTNADVWLVPVDGSAPPRNLSAAFPGWDAMPTFSPDGQSIAWVSMPTPGYENDWTRVALFDRRRGETRFLFERASFSDHVHRLAWTPDGRHLLFHADREGRTPVFKLDPRSGSVAEVFRHGFLDAWQPTPDGASVVYTARTIDRPTELYRVPASGGAPTRLTRFNAALEAEVDLRPAEELWLEGDGGTRIHTFLIKPHGFDPTKKYPLILNVHGGPQGMWADSWRGDWQVYPGAGYIVAFPNPTGSTGYGQDLTDAIACDWGGRVYRDVMKVADALSALPYVDASKMGAMGWSYGGYMMMWLAGHTDRFAALAAMMGIYDLDSFYGGTEELWFPEKDLCGQPWSSDHYRRWSPALHAERFSTPTLVVTGEKDYRVPYTQSLDFFTALQRRKVPSRLVVFPKAGHWPGWIEMAFYYTAHLDWFHQHLGGGGPPWSVEDFLRNRVFEGADE